jgi:hypothetical protein
VVHHPEQCRGAVFLLVFRLLFIISPVFLAAGSNILADSVFLLPPKGPVSPQEEKNRLFFLKTHLILLSYHFLSILSRKYTPFRPRRLFKGIA